MRKLSLIIVIGFTFFIGCETKPISPTYEPEAVTPVIEQTNESISDDSTAKPEPATPTPEVEVNPGGPYPFEQHARIVEEWYNTVDVYRVETLPDEYDWANKFGDFNFFHLNNSYTVLEFDTIYEAGIAEASSKFAEDNGLEYIIEQSGNTITAMFAVSDLWHLHSSWVGVPTLIQRMRLNGQTASDMTLDNPEGWEKYIEESRY